MLQGAIPLTTYSNILPFEEVSGRTRARALASDDRDFPEPFTSPFSVAPRAGSKASRPRSSARSARGGARNVQGRASAVRGSDRAAAGFAPSSRTQRPARSRYDAEGGFAHDGERRAEDASSHRSRRGQDAESKVSAFWRSRRKAKADRAFDRRYADSDASDSAGPRAALYKGQMGSTHRKAARMQDRGHEGAGTARRSAGKKRSQSHAGLLYGLAAVAACVALAFVIVYPAARDYYVTLRATAQQQAEYDALVARHDYVQGEVDRLSTDEGIEDEASKELGWVKEGENAVYVNGLEDSEEPPVYADVVAGSVPAPDTWYSGVLDPLFGVDPNNGSSSR